MRPSVSHSAGGCGAQGDGGVEMAVATVPPAQWAHGELRNPAGQIMTGFQFPPDSTYYWLENDLAIPQLSMFEEVGTGVPEIGVQCQDTVNEAARQRPQAAIAVGHEGLLRAVFACIAEQTGAAPVDFSAAVLNELLPSGRSQVPWMMVLGIVALVAVGGVFLLKKRS